GVNIDMPVSVKDSDNQGVRVSSGVTIRNDIPTQNKIKTNKIQTALSLFGNNISLIGLKGQGTADSTNSATSEFITGRGAWAIGSTLDNIYIDGVQVEGYTTAIDVMNAKNWRIRNVKFKGMCYGGSGLGYAGGYGILTQAGVDGLDIDGVYHTL
ncbi:TPA: hypothetical protein P4E08_005513, partial [Klebsiella pneumoniae]|nr:hypothetical protein [Klebsiella pneumoniae]